MSRASMLLVVVAAILMGGIGMASAGAAAGVRPHPLTPAHLKRRPLSPAQLRKAEDSMSRSLKERKGPWTQARERALFLDDRARVLQDKGQLFKDRSALARAKGSSSGDRAAMMAYDRSELNEDRARLLEDKSHLYSDRAKMVAGKEARVRELAPDVPRKEQTMVHHRINLSVHPSISLCV
jgi:hypothetical protein